MSSPTVSVVTPFYNRRRWLQSCLEMLELQTLKDFELIIVDDGSTDGLGDALASTSTKFPLRFIRLAKNAGPSTARNMGIDAAQGRYVALLDSDDAWHPDKLRLHVEQFEATSDRDRLVGLSRQLVIGNELFVRPKRLMSRSDRVGKYLFQLGGVIQSSAMFLATNLARAARFPDGEYEHEDWAFALHLEAIGARFEMLPQGLTYYRDDDRADRASPPYTRKRLDWLERYRGRLGEQAYYAARAAFASHMHSESPIASLGMMTTGFLRGEVPIWRTAYYFAAWAFPSVRKLGTRARRAWSGRGLSRTALPEPHEIP